MYRIVWTAFLAFILLVSAASAQRAEITISLNEAFFESLLDSVFKNFEAPEFPISGLQAGISTVPVSAFVESTRQTSATPACVESIRILHELNDVRTAVRFRDGKIFVPLAFSGSYAPPFVGCVDFAGWAETNIDLEFDKNAQRLIGRARILNVNLNGTGGIGGTVIAKLVQKSIDKKLNPIEILSLDKLSVAIPIKKSGSLKMRALRIRPEVVGGLLNIRVDYEFVKG